MLKIESLHVTIASVQALRGFSLEVQRGSMVGLVGRNGAGKTSLMRTVMGHLPASDGAVSFDGADLARLPRHARAGLGIGYMPEDRGLVPELTVEENILVPVWASKTLKTGERLRFVYDVLPELRAMRGRRALLLSGGQQKLAALARALAVGTRLLLLDEPFEGLAPAVVEDVFRSVDQLRTEIAILIIEHDLDLVLSLADRAYVLDRGHVTHEGPAAPLLGDLEFRKQVLWL
jgi:branched-chain amino acid transport system ATP-binding protein